MVNVILNPLGKWWKAMEHSIAWRLLGRAQKGDRYDRLKAIHQLALIDHLKGIVFSIQKIKGTLSDKLTKNFDLFSSLTPDWDFQHLAQLCDARTAVSLARSDCDKRWFLKPKMHNVLKNARILLKEIEKLFEEMLPNKCITYFLHTHANFNLNDKEPENDD